MNDEFFISVFVRENFHWFSWVYMVSHSHDSREWEYDIRVAKPGYGSAYSYVGRVHPIDERGSRIRRSSNCFVITDNTVKSFMTKEGLPEARRREGYDFRLPVEYRINRVPESTESRY